MAGNQEDFLSERDLAALAKEWLSSLFQPDAGQPSASTYDPPTYPQYSPDPTDEERKRAMLDSDEQVTGPGIGEAITFMPPGGLAAKGLGAATKSLLQLLKRGKGDDALMKSLLKKIRAKRLAERRFRDAERARLGPDEYRRWRRKAMEARDRDVFGWDMATDKPTNYRHWSSYPNKNWWEGKGPTMWGKAKK